MLAGSVTLLIGVGNEYRSDDGIGLIVARNIQRLKLPDVIVKEESGEGVALIEAWQGFEKVVLVDAVSSGAKSGKVFKIDANKEKVPTKFFHYSTHAFSVAEAVELARTLNNLPQKLLIFGIEGENFSPGTKFSPFVMEAADKIIDKVLREFYL